MAKYIEREAAVAIIEEKQKELCPFGRYSRTVVYGSDRDRFDSWQEIINSIEAIPAADVVEVKLLDDGTLVVTTDKYPHVNRVFVEDGKTSGSLFYAEEV